VRQAVTHKPSCFNTTVACTFHDLDRLDYSERELTSEIMNPFRLLVGLLRRGDKPNAKPKIRTFMKKSIISQNMRRLINMHIKLLKNTSDFLICSRIKRKDRQNCIPIPSIPKQVFEGPEALLKCPVF
jgi:hypothetical protein